MLLDIVILEKCIPRSCVAELDIPRLDERLRRKFIVKLMNKLIEFNPDLSWMLSASDYDTLTDVAN